MGVIHLTLPEGNRHPPAQSRTRAGSLRRVSLSDETRDFPPFFPGVRFTAHPRDRSFLACGQCEDPFLGFASGVVDSDPLAEDELLPLLPFLPFLPFLTFLPFLPFLTFLSLPLCPEIPWATLSRPASAEAVPRTGLLRQSAVQQEASCFSSASTPIGKRTEEK